MWDGKARILGCTQAGCLLIIIAMEALIQKSTLKQLKTIAAGTDSHDHVS